ncbi:391_t:CDS:10 [Acaulospora morrowiae]|uniref:391_t:CDS:1 n=1 Tax=Acaulospora morrowiae TaxID=94023 RepID=A0A9N9GW59_9GLOM|nr:391_t:CDS:10 [Acaulospora morrowiae]
MESKILSSYQLPRPTGKKILIKCVASRDWLAVKVLSNRIHVFFREILREIWNFSNDPVEILQDKLYKPLEKENQSSVNFLVLTSDGSIWRIQSQAPKKRRNFEAELEESKDSPSRQVRKIDGSSGDSTTTQNVVHNRDYSTEFHSRLLPPSIITVTEGHKVFHQKNTCAIRSCNLFNTHGIMMMCHDGEIGFLSLINQTPTNKIIFQPETLVRSDPQNPQVTCLLCPYDPKKIGNANDPNFGSSSRISSELAMIAFGSPNLQQEMLLTGYSNGLICYQSLVIHAPSPGVVTALKEPIQSIYTLSLKRESVDESRIVRTPITEKLHNAFLIVGTKCTIALMAVATKTNGDSDKKSIAYKEYYVSEPIHSSFLFKNRLILAAGTGRIIVMNFDDIVFSGDKLVSLYTIPAYLPMGIVELCYHCDEDKSSNGGILYALSREGKLIRASFLMTNENKPKHLMNAAEMKNEIRIKLNRIAELSAQQDELEKINELLNGAIAARNMVIPELQRLYKRRDSAKDKSPPLKVECYPVTTSTSLAGSVVHRAYLKIRLTSNLGINWSQYWSLIIRMVNLNMSDSRSTKNSNDPFSVMSYSVSLGDMTVIWERDVEINLRYLQFPILIKLGLCFSPPTPMNTSNDEHYQSKSSYFFLLNVQYDILDFIKPCSTNILHRLQKERHFTVYPTMPEFVPPLDGNFFATRNEFRKTLESIVSIYGSNTIREEKPVSDFIESLNCGSAAIKFFLRASKNSDSKHTDAVDPSVDDAFDRCLTMLLGEAIEASSTYSSKLQEIVTKPDYAVFIAPLSLDPVIINLRRLDENCIEETVPLNSIPTELRIKCDSTETLLLVEEAILGRLEDFSSKDEAEMDIDEPVYRFVNQEVMDKISRIKHNRNELRKLHGIHMDSNNENPVNWEDLLKISEHLENDVKEVVNTVKAGIDNTWLGGVVEL